MDTQRTDPSLPRLAAYLAQLPDAERSHPACLAKASIVRPFFPPGANTLPPGAPRWLSDLVAQPPPPTSWIPEVHLMALTLAVADREGDDDAFVAWTANANRALIKSAWYAVLMRAASPAMLLKGAAMRWGTLHRGTEISVLHVGAGRATLKLDFPPTLFTPLLLRAYGTGFVAAIEVARGEDVRVDLVEVKPALAVYEATWR